MKQFFKAFAVAFGMYSKIPMPRFEWASEDMKYHLCFFPFVGAVIGGLEILWYQFCWNWKAFSVKGEIPQLLFLCAGLVIPLLVTGGFHVDGFMDTMDALHSYGDRQKRLEILKDPHVGAFSIISLVVFVLLVLGSGSIFCESGKFWGAVAVGFSFVISRALSGLGVVFFPKAKKEGMMAVESGTVNRPFVGTVLLAELVAAVAGCIILTFGMGKSFCGIVSVGAMLCVFCWYFFMSRKQFGGINGDLAGFFVCLSEGSGLFGAGVCLLAEALWF